MPPAVPKPADTFYEPLTEDVEDLLGRFQQKDSIRFDVFSAVWRDMRFSDVFRGVLGMSDTRKFSKAAMATAVKYFLPPYCLHVRVGGLYLMYAFYHTQLAVPPVSIRLALGDWDHIQSFLQKLAVCGHLDVVYVFRSLVSSKAFHYTAMPILLTFQKSKRQSKTLCREMLARTTAVMELLTEDFLAEVTNVQTVYEKMKQEVAEVRLQAAMTHPQFAARLKGSLTDFMAWQQNTFHPGKDEKPACDDDDSRSRARLMAAIKKKSYGRKEGGPKSERQFQQDVNAVDSSSSEPEQGEDCADPHRVKPLSLRARTWKSLGKNTEKSELAPWLLSAPDHEGVPLRRKWHGRSKQ
ncbi:snRNA-activating protein complex subunit 1-like [Entelurus aequoreus]|uniref:snRNA-activating protein complex subunit 1-like n=1 Tax=Entelurus aequoreus TaxID=161455 RepID=UPI002B1CE759|nr:snRNA-activating protein complex subunit 1-like [Entelurus aequoreus]